MKIKNLNRVAAMGLAAITAFSATSSVAGESAELIINGEEKIVTRAPAPAHMDIDEVISGWVFRADETQAFQMDDFDNPGMIFVDQAMDTWNKVEGAAGKSCADCHDGPETFAGLRTVLPRYNPDAKSVWTMEQYINNCRTERMQADAWKWTGGKMAAMNALVSLQSRGQLMNIAIDGPAKETWELGKEMYYARTGQLELSCANCHEDSYGKMIRADHLSQGQINGFPVYRLKNAKLNSVHARFKGCVRDTRAETYKPGSEDFIALELYVASRGNGLASEAPSIRN